MVGQISARPMKICCEKVFTKMANSKNETVKCCSTRSIKRFISQHTFVFIFGSLFCLVLFVLYITNQKPVYKHNNIQFHENNEDIHDVHNSKNHYGVVIDCGSSGSRVYIYYWPPHSGSKDELLHIKQMLDIDGNPVRQKIRPGISSFADTPQNASSSLKPLLQFAANHVPHVKHRETPLYIFATAGMRLLPADKRNGILKNLALEVPKMTTFYFTKSQVEVISGKQEGVYLWIATNYMLDRFDHGIHSHENPLNEDHFKRKSTVGTIEIGGASLQIAYEVQSNDSLSPETLMTINLGCDTHHTTHRYQIYVTTFLGLGTDFGRKTYVNSLCKEKQELPKSETNIICDDPCLPTDMIDDQVRNNIPLKLKGTGQFNQCQEKVSKTLNVTAECKKPPCSFNGVHHAPIDFKNAEFYGFSEFWYSSNDVLRVGGKYSSDKIEKEAKNFCQTRWSLHKKHYAMGFFPKADQFRFRYQCFKSAWITSVLHDGYKFPKDYQGLTTVQLLKGKELQWTLGALLYHTRFLPLRDMSLESSISGKALSHSLWILILHDGFFPILFSLAGIVVLLVVIYFRRLRHFSSTITVYPHDNFSSMVTEKKNFPYDIRVEM